MTVSFIGTGKMAEGIATRFRSGNGSVGLSGRNRSRAERLAATLEDRVKSGAEVRVLDPGDALPGEVVVLAVPYAAASSVLKEYGQRLSGKIVVDITNPLNDRYDGLVTPEGSSGAEELSKLLPSGARIVKAFNTVFSGTLLEGSVAGVPLDVFIAADDAAAKKTVSAFIRQSGLNPVEVGPLARSRELEELAFLSISMQSVLNTGFRTAWKLILPE